MKKLKAYECVMRFDVEPIRRAYTKKEFEILYPKVVKNGYIIVDD